MSATKVAFQRVYNGKSRYCENYDLEVALSSDGDVMIDLTNYKSTRRITLKPEQWRELSKAVNKTPRPAKPSQKHGPSEPKARRRVFA